MSIGDRTLSLSFVISVHVCVNGKNVIKKLNKTIFACCIATRITSTVT